MKKLSKVLAMCLAVVMMLSMTTMTAFAAEGDGTQANPYTEVPETLTLNPGDTVYINAPVGGKEIIVTSDSMNTCASIMTETAQADTTDGKTVSYVFDETDENIMFAISVADWGRNPAETLTITVGEPRVGTASNPLVVEESSVAEGYYIMNEALEAEDMDGYWYEINVEEDSVFYVEFSCADDTVEYSINATVYDKDGVARLWPDASTGNPMVVGSVEAGETIVISKAVGKNWDTMSVPAATIYMTGIFCAGEDELSAVPLKDATVGVPVGSGETLCVTDSTKDAAYAGHGVVISVDEWVADKMADVVVTVDGVDYVDEDNDGAIEFMLEGGFMSRPAMYITNDSDMDLKFTVAAVEEAKEGYFAPSTDHELLHVNAVEPGCHFDGNIEYWYCEECDVFYADEECTQVIAYLSTIIPATGEGNLVHIEAVEPGCHYEGNIEYWVCYDCEQVWQDEALTQLTNIKNVVLAAEGGDVVHVEAKPACVPNEDGELENGNIEHWYCEECGQVWQDEALTQLTNRMNVILPAGAHNIVHIEAVAPGCHYEGNQEYWYCADCESVWADEELTQLTNFKNVIVPETGDGEVVHIEAVAPGCHYEGNIEYWVCYECEQVWQDEALTQLTNIKNVIVPATGEGNLVHIEAVEPGCHYEGNIEYWVCYECEQVWQDEALTQLTNIKNVIVPELGGEIIHVEAVAPTATENGNIEYWYCEECEQVWQDEACTQLTNFKNVIIPATGVVVPGTGDSTNVALWVVVFALGVVAIAGSVVMKKREF